MRTRTLEPLSRLCIFGLPAKSSPREPLFTILRGLKKPLLKVAHSLPYQRAHATAAWHQMITYDIPITSVLKTAMSIMPTAKSTFTAASLLEFLKDPASYPEPTTHVELIETHISWVFLTNHFAYKLKKPVQFQFLDFSQPDARRLACEEEVRLNRRLTHNVYLSTLSITFDPRKGLEINGVGEEVDCLVKMRRLPDKYALNHLLEQNKLTDANIVALSDHLTTFYCNLPPKVLQPQEHHRHLVSHCEANQKDLLGSLAATQESRIRRIHGSQIRYLALQECLFYDRVRDGRIVDGHGDLRAEHIFLETPPAIIDCVEFSDELREVDVLDDLSFLAMDCQRLGNSKVGERLLETYQKTSGDEPPPALEAFYRSYRACVRAKIAAIHQSHADDMVRKRLVRETHQYLNWADYFSAQLGPPTLTVTGGLMGTGKTTLATEIAKTIGAKRISTDEIRQSLFGKSKSPAEYGVDNYQASWRDRVYDELLSRACRTLDDGCSVVLDGTFLTNELRRRALEQGKQHGAHVFFIECECPEEISLERIAERAKAGTTESEARPELYREQCKAHEEIESGLPSIRIASTTTLNEELRLVCAALQADLFPN